MHLFRSTFELDASGATQRKPREDKVGNLTLLSTNSRVLRSPCAAISSEKEHDRVNANPHHELFWLDTSPVSKGHTTFWTMLAEMCLTLSVPQRLAGMVVYAPQPARCDKGGPMKCYACGTPFGRHCMRLDEDLVKYLYSTSINKMSWMRPSEGLYSKRKLSPRYPDCHPGFGHSLNLIQVDSPAAVIAEEHATHKAGDWWTGSEYNGRRYRELPAVTEVHLAEQTLMMHSADRLYPLPKAFTRS